jgi:hypothetical protein
MGGPQRVVRGLSMDCCCMNLGGQKNLNVAYTLRKVFTTALNIHLKLLEMEASLITQVNYFSNTKS